MAAEIEDTFLVLSATSHLSINGMKFLASSGQINVSHELRADKSQLQAQYGQEEKRAEIAENGGK